jgi:Macrocin-O-methyltransferase (TylF)
MPLYTNFNAIFRHPLDRDKRREFRRSRPSRQAEREQHQAEREQHRAEREQLEAARQAEREQREQLEAARQAEREQHQAEREQHQAERERHQAEREQHQAEREQHHETTLQLYIAHGSLQRAVARNDELIRERQLEPAFVAVRAENAALAERAAIAADLKSALTRVALADTVASQLSDVRDRLASRLELLTSEVSDVRRRVGPSGQPDGSGETRRLYLDLLESALTGILTRDGNASPWGAKEFDPDRRLYGRDWPKTALTMIGTARMRNLRRLVETALAEGVEGDLLEAGVWRGGACLYMRGILAAHGIKNRTVWVADSFAGLPKPDEALYPADKGDIHHTFNDLCVSLDEVKGNFERFGLLDEQVAFLPGWFKDTLPEAPIKQLSVLRLDGDMYGSTIETLEALYPRIARGGFIIVDDYILPGCRKAVDDFRLQRGIDQPLHDVDGAAAYWRRT